MFQTQVSVEYPLEPDREPVYSDLQARQQCQHPHHYLDFKDLQGITDAQEVSFDVLCHSVLLYAGCLQDTHDSGPAKGGGVLMLPLREHCAETAFAVVGEIPLNLV